MADAADRPCGDKKPRITLTLEALPSTTPAAIRVRLALKRIFRGLGLRCVEISGALGDELLGDGRP
jgi:hypothetical protein